MLSRRPCVWSARFLGLSWPGADPWISWELVLLCFASLWAFQALKVLAAIALNLDFSISEGAFHVSLPDVPRMLIQREADERRLHPCAHPVHEISGSILILVMVEVGRRGEGASPPKPILGSKRSCPEK